MLYLPKQGLTYQKMPQQRAMKIVSVLAISTSITGADKKTNPMV